MIISNQLLFNGSTLNLSEFSEYKKQILPRLLQRSKKCRGHYSTIYHAMSQWVIRSETHLSFGHNVKNSLRLKLKVMSITCRCAKPIK